MDILVAVLKHPLTLLLAGAVLTNYLIPRITRRWQDRQKEIELKTAFVSEVSDAALEMLISVQYAEFGAKSQTQNDYDEAYRRWETERARIGARMRGFFPDTGLQEKWQALADAITSVLYVYFESKYTYRTDAPLLAHSWRRWVLSFSA